MAQPLLLKLNSILAQEKKLVDQLVADHEKNSYVSSSGLYDAKEFVDIAEEKERIINEYALANCYGKALAKTVSYIHSDELKIELKSNEYIYINRNVIAVFSTIFADRKSIKINKYEIPNSDIDFSGYDKKSAYINLFYESINDQMRLNVVFNAIRRAMKINESIDINDDIFYRSLNH